MDGMIRVLIVEDEEMVRENLAAFFEDEGFAVFTAGTGEDALAALSSHAFDVGIVDMRLPGMDGNTLIVKAHELQPSMRFLIHTGSATYELPATLRVIGMTQDHVFKKPLADMAELARAARGMVP
jgi:DNA-binding NtrC family response regulator